MSGKQKITEICGAQLKSKRKGKTICTRPAGWGTWHKGTGRCKLHGGGKETQPTELLVYCDPQLAPRANKIFQDPDILNLRKELAVLKARFETIKTQPDFSDVKLLTTLARTIGTLAARIHEMEIGRHHYIHISVTGAIINAFTEIGRKYIPDPRLRSQFVDEVEEAIRKSIRSVSARAIAARSLTPFRGDVIIDPEIIEAGREVK